MYRFRITNKSMQIFIDLISGCLVVQSFDSIHFVKNNQDMYFHKDDCVIFQVTTEETGPYGISASDTALLSDMCSIRKNNSVSFVDINLEEKKIRIAYNTDELRDFKTISFQLSNLNYIHSPTDFMLSFMNYLMTSNYNDNFDLFLVDRIKKNDQNMLSRMSPTIYVNATKELKFMVGTSSYPISAYALDSSTTTNKEIYTLEFEIEDLRSAMTVCERTLRFYIPKTNSTIHTQTIDLYILIKTSEYNLIQTVPAVIKYTQTEL